MASQQGTRYLEPSLISAGVSAMPPKVVAFANDPRFVRRSHELKTIEAMVAMYCRGHRHLCGQGHREERSDDFGRRQPLCADCVDLQDYAKRRLERCVFGDAKPTCANCVVHCYSAEMRNRIRIVMRWAGPRMLLRHPLLALSHMIYGRRSVPTLPAKPVRQDSQAAP